MSLTEGRFEVTQAATPIAYEAGLQFNKSHERLEAKGYDFPAYVDVVQENFRHVLRALAEMELKVRSLTGEDSSGQ